MSNFQESGINFKFQSPQWTVVKYDEHLAHKKVSNALQPTKAVDFLGIHDNGQLFLIEVKNYRGHTHDEETRNVLQAKGDELMRRIAVKVRDTIATVTGSARFSTNDEAFFTQVNQLLVDDRKKIVIIACIELDATDDKERKAQMSVWMQKLNRNCHGSMQLKSPSIRLTTLLLSCPIRKSHSYKYLPYNKRVSKPSFPHFKKSTTFVSVLIQKEYICT